MDLQCKFWNDMVELKFHIFYLDEYIDKSYYYDNCINIITAITSSSSIAAWAIWNKFNFIWAILIAISQVISAVSIHLPYKKRIKYLSELNLKLSRLYLEYDKIWYEVANGFMTTEEINNKITELRIKKYEVEKKHTLYNSLPKKQTLIEKADNANLQYFDTYYNVQQK